MFCSFCFCTIVVTLSKRIKLSIRMKRIFTISMVAAAMLCSIVSCASGKSIPQKLDKFVTEAESNSQKYTKDEWTRSRQDYEALLNQYMENSDKYSQEEKEVAIKAMGRYHALVLKNGIQQGADLLKKYAALLPSYFDGFASGLQGEGVNLEEAIKSVIDEEKLDKAVENLGKALESIFGSAKESK